MSIKLYDGYRLAPGTDPFEFQARVRAALDPVRDFLEARMLISRAITMIDGCFMDEPTEALREQPASAAIMHLLEELSEHSPSSTFHDPNRFSFGLGPDPETGQLYVLLFYVEDEYKTAWEALPEVEPFPYWDNTDRPDDVSAAEWKDRAAIWDRVLSQGKLGLTFTLRPETAGTPFVSREEAEQFFKDTAPAFDRDARASRLVPRLVINAIAAEFKASDTDLSFHDAARLLESIRTSQTSKPFVALVSQVAQSLPELSVSAIYEIDPDWLPTPAASEVWKPALDAAVEHVFPLT